MKINLGSYEVNVNIVYKNNKNIYFRFDDALNLIITCPKHTSDFEISKLISKNELALIKMYQKAIEKNKYDNEFWYLGKKYDVIYDNKHDIVEFIDNVCYARDEDALADFLEDEIDVIFHKEINICKKCFNNLPEFSLKTRYMKTRWGVCNRRNNTITLNTELIKKDIDLLDYVIIHEMAHFYEGNHSKNFWAIVEAACPNYKERRNRLNHENNKSK